MGPPRLDGFAVIGLCSLHWVPEVADVAGLVALEDGGTVLAIVPAGQEDRLRGVQGQNLSARTVCCAAELLIRAQLDAA